MNDPIRASDGFVYDRKAYEGEYPAQATVPDVSLKAEIDYFFKAKPLCTEKEFLNAIQTGDREDVEKLNFLDDHLNMLVSYYAPDEKEVEILLLHFAVYQGLTDIVELLIDEG